MFIRIDDAQIYSTAFGFPSASALIGIGGWIGSWELWAEPFSILSQTWHTVAYDHRGAGATLAPVETITLDHLVDDVFAVLDAYQIDHCVLAAESAGALTALAAALKKPDRILGLVIVDGSYYQPISTAATPFLMGLQNHYAATLAHFVEACVPEPDSAHIKRCGLQILQRASPEAAIALYRMADGIDLRDDFGKITQPTLILHSGLDTIAPIASAEWLARTIPNSKLRIINDAGHVPTVTRAPRVAAEINAFFGGKAESL